MKRTIFFDLGNVILFFDHKKMAKQLSHCCQIDIQLIQNAISELGDPYERGDLDSKTIYEKMTDLSDVEIEFAPFMRAMGDIFVPNDPVVEIVLDLKKRGHSLFLLSNTCHAHFEFAQNEFPFLKAFDGYVLSYEARARKPEIKIYEKALEIARCQKEECFYTDDLPQYVEAAKTFGIDAELYTTPQILTQHLASRGFI